MIRFHANGLSVVVLLTPSRITFPHNRRSTASTLYPAVVSVNDAISVIAQTRSCVQRPAHLTCPAQVQEEVDEAEHEDCHEQRADDDKVDGHRGQFSPGVRIVIRRLFSNESSIVISLQ